MTDIEAEIEALASRAVDGLEDAGEARLKRAHIRRAYAEAIIRQVAARHGVSVDAILRKHQSRQKHHVVMARANAACLLHDAQYSYPEIGRLMGMSHHSQAIRAVLQWQAHLAGQTEVQVDEVTGREAIALIEKHGLTIRTAAAWLEVPYLKLKGRIGTIRSRERSK